MHPALAYEIAKARQADLRRQADQAALGGAARRARLAVAAQPASPAAGLARRALGMLAALAWAVRGSRGHRPTASLWHGAPDCA